MGEGLQSTFFARCGRRFGACRLTPSSSLLRMHCCHCDQLHDVAVALLGCQVDVQHMHALPYVKLPVLVNLRTT